MKINWKIRIQNPIWWAQIAAAIFVPIMTYFGLKATDLTSFGIVFDTLGKAISNPYVLGLVVVNVWSTINDPTTSGLKDSKQAMTYIKPKKEIK